MNEEPNSYFTYSYYARLLDAAQARGYAFSTFAEQRSPVRRAYLRHDLDVSISAALPLARIESQRSLRSTFFLMLDTVTYNVSSSEDRHSVHELIGLGHEIGLHYSPKENLAPPAQEVQIAKEARLLGEILEQPVVTFSLHRPAPGILNLNLRPLGLSNAYSSEFFSERDYISDSNHQWRCGDPLAFIQNHRGDFLQILTHPIWWAESPATVGDRLQDFLRANRDRTQRYLCQNIKAATAALAKPADQEET